MFVRCWSSSCIYYTGNKQWNNHENALFNITFVFVSYRNSSLSSAILLETWKIYYEDISIIPQKKGSQMVRIICSRLLRTCMYILVFGTCTRIIQIRSAYCWYKDGSYYNKEGLKEMNEWCKMKYSWTVGKRGALFVTASLWSRTIKSVSAKLILVLKCTHLWLLLHYYSSRTVDFSLYITPHPSNGPNIISPVCVREPLLSRFSFL